MSHAIATSDANQVTLITRAGVLSDSIEFQITYANGEVKTLHWPNNQGNWNALNCVLSNHLHLGHDGEVVSEHAWAESPAYLSRKTILDRSQAKAEADLDAYAQAHHHRDR